MRSSGVLRCPVVFGGGGGVSRGIKKEIGSEIDSEVESEIDLGANGIHRES